MTVSGLDEGTQDGSAAVAAPAPDREPEARTPAGTGGGATVWLTGLPSAGKTTIAEAVARTVRGRGRRTEVLDGDVFRSLMSPGLGFDRADRDRNVQRLGLVADLLARNGVLVLVSAIAPYADSRAAVRECHRRSQTPYLEVHVATPVQVCAERDVKGLYAKQAAGVLTGLTGVDSPYEAPESPDLRVDTRGRSVADTAASVCALLTSRGLL